MNYFLLKQKKNLIIKKNTFDLREKYFNNTEIIKKTIDMNYISNILITDNENVVLTHNRNVIVLNV